MTNRAIQRPLKVCGTARFSACRFAALGCLLALAVAPPVGRGDDRPAAQIVEEIRALDSAPAERPRGAAGKDAAARRAATERRSRLIKELLAAHPDAPELADLLPERWAVLMASPRTLGEAQAEAARVVERSMDEGLVAEAAATRARIALRKVGTDPKAREAATAVDDFARRFPKDERGAELLAQLARATKDKAKKAAIAERIARDYPDAAVNRPASADAAADDGPGATTGAIGKPFAIAFVDAIRGRRVTTASLKGKVVVVDFWATWCGPCVAELPKMKQLYAEYKPKGVEFVGVSLDSPPDEGGYDKLVTFVAENGINWPQYYQGNGWASEFSKSWGIKSIPAVFVVDAEGKLVSTEARGKLEQLLPELLDKAKKGKKGGEVKP